MNHDLKPLLPRNIFLRRFAKNIAIGLAITFCALAIGISGYHYFEDMPWVNAFENAAMILSGMGPVAEMKTVSGKIFAGIYALFSGTLFLVVIAIVFAPVIRRFLHKFHLDVAEKKE
jgi:type IV secretory pathway VirB2 component (pilin)